MFRALFFIFPLLCPLLTLAQDLKFELLTKWESLTPEFPIDFGNSKNGFKLFNIGDFNNDGVPDIGLKTSKSSIVWDKKFGGRKDEYPTSIQQTFDGGYIVAGGNSVELYDSIGNDLGQTTDIWILKLDSSGNKIWDKTYEESEYGNARSIKQTYDGGYVFIGENYGTAFDDGVIKLDSNGNNVWDKTLGGSLKSIQQTSDGGYVVAGSSSNSDGNNVSDYWVVKLDSSGNKIWDKTLGGSSSDRASSIKQTSDGGYIIAGNTESSDGDISDGDNGYDDCWIVKLDSNGNKVWDKTFGDENDDNAEVIQQTFDGGYIIGGYTISYGDGQGEYDNYLSYWIIKLDSLGYKVWDKTIKNLSSGGMWDTGSILHQTFDGGYVFAGHTNNSRHNNITDRYDYDYWIVKLDELGNQIWDKTIGGEDSDIPISIAQTADGDYIIAGYTSSEYGDISENNSSKNTDLADDPWGDGWNDYWIVKLDGDVIPYDSLYILTLNKNGSVNNTHPIVPGVSGFNYSAKRDVGWAGFGTELINLGDIDGNGTDDFLVSSPKENLNNGSIDGALFILFMNSNGSVKDFTILSKSEIISNENPNNSDYLHKTSIGDIGYSMTSIGDLDGDGINEVALHTAGDHFNNPDTMSAQGFIHVFFFNPQGAIKKSTSNNVLTFYTDTSNWTIGISAIHNAGDLDSNGVDDVLIDVYKSGISILYLDSEGKAIDLKQISKEDSNIKASGNYFGQTLSSTVDIDNDGNNEIISQFSLSTADTVPLFTTGIIYYNDSFSVSKFELINPNDIDGVNLDVNSGESFGNKSVYLGDINRDGYPEIGIIDMYKNNPDGNDGVVYIVSIKPADCIETTCVWPGDANNDGVANCIDLFSIARGFKKVSSPNKRILPVNTWVAQKANDWGELNDDVDMKFADCDGNGVVDRNDISSIKLNYNLTHQKNNIIDLDENGPLLRIVPAQQNLSPDDTAQFDIFLGEQIKNAENVFGLNMTVRPTSLSLYNDSIYVDYTDSWIGNVDSNAIHLEHQLTDGISFAIARTDHKNTTNYGKIANIKIPLTNNPIEKFTLEVTELNIESHEGDILLVNDIIADSVSVVDSTTINSSISVISTINSYPNPTSDIVYFNLKEEIKNIAIYSAVGYLIKNEPVNATSFNIDLSSLTNGTYFISLQGKDKTYKSTIILKE
ncbi:MAG: hypothetical protein CMP61_01640 [Flavobacteriales bacterium]|nr:hypothetical protein [Flavobacteriales bacterium]|tara:strand:- start:3670 stop:7203 length:3534 start_codon:yes stop_codon:yes gene_type:complete